MRRSIGLSIATLVLAASSLAAAPPHDSSTSTRSSETLARSADRTLAVPISIAFNRHAPMVSTLAALEIGPAACSVFPLERLARSVSAPAQSTAPMPATSIAPLEGRNSRPGNGTHDGGNPLPGLLGLFAIGALAADRDTKRRDGRDLSLPVKTGVKIYAGGLVALSATGYAQPGAIALGLVAVGRAKNTIDNTLGADGDVNIEVERGTFLYKNSGGDAVTKAEVGKFCFIVDDETVSKTGSTTKTPAGIVREVTNAGVWVEVGAAPADASITSRMIEGGAGVAALIAAGLGASAAYTKITNGVQVLLAADAVKDRAVLIIAQVTEAFADAGGTQTKFKIGQVATDDKFAAEAVFTNAALNAVKVLAGVLSATRNLIVTADDAAGAGTGAITVTVLALPTA